MSYIDTFDHELVGFFAGLPVYHPLETVSGTGDDLFGCTPSHLVLGGGDGEHPAIVLTHPTAAVAAFLQAALPPDGPPLSAASEQFLDALPPLHECLHFAGWFTTSYSAFLERCSSASFVAPYRPAHDGLLESWVLCNLGEFVYFSMPDLAPDIRVHLAELCARVTSPIYYNVLILPPGYGSPAGRYRTASGDVIWGNYAWRTERFIRP